ncbi:MAG TPA: ferritin [Planctomycetota bacterium]|nr:ferritin [Planctomycetota bacterium]
MNTPAIGIKPDVLAELQRQMNQELSSSHAYLALAVWCELQNFKGFARYFSKQAAEERVHAQRFVKHLLDRGVLPALAALPAPAAKLKSLMDVAHHAQDMERKNTAGINAAYEAALRTNDYPAQVLLHAFISEQVEEEDWADEMVDRVETASCAGGVSDLDRHIERYLTDDAANVAMAAEGPKS